MELISLHSCHFISQLSRVSHCSPLSPTTHTHTHSPLPLPGLQCFQQEKNNNNNNNIIIIILKKIAIIKKIYSIHFLLVYYIGIFCTQPKSSLYLHSDPQGLILGSLVLLALSGELKPTLQSRFFNFIECTILS